MQINSNNGSILRLKQIKDDNVQFLVYDSDIVLSNSAVQTITISGLTDYILNQCIVQLGTDYTLSDNQYNWLFKAENRFIRLFIPSTLFTAEKLKGSYFAALCDSLISPLNPYIVPHSTSGDIHSLYLAQVHPQHVLIVNPFILNGSVRCQRFIPEHEETIIIPEVTENVLIDPTNPMGGFNTIVVTPSSTSSVTIPETVIEITDLNQLGDLIF